MRGGAWRSPPWDSDQPLRAELFSVERLEQHATTLAAAQDVSTKPAKRRPLDARLKNNEAVLLAAYRSIADAARDGHAITPAAEWLLDNYHLVDEQIREIREDLPPRFYRQLPKLASGPLIGYPRVVGIAWAYVSHSDSRFDLETLRRFVHAYQKVQALTIGELWAIAITLRIMLVENLRRAAERIVGNRIAREEADRIADQLFGVNGVEPDALALILRHEGGAPLSAAFVVQLVKRLRDQDPRVTPALEWLEGQLAARGTTLDETVRDEHQRQGASNVTVRNIITSMRLISDVNWPDWFEDVSLVDAVLRSPGGPMPVKFEDMDFATRNLYRSAIEELARGAQATEIEIAQAAIAAARRPATAANDARRQSDPGYYLVARGRRAFERSIGYRVPLGTRLHWLNAWLGPVGYIGFVWLATAAILVMPLAALHARGVTSSHLAWFAALGFIPAMGLAVALVNQVVTRTSRVTMLPTLALREGVPAPLRTLVVVPTLLTSREAVAEQIERLEVHHLASIRGEIHFALVTDWADATTEHAQGDDELLAIAVEGIARLNRAHGPTADGERFYLLHRRRVWSEGERRWMGWERKRGKLHELNRLLRGALDTTFIGSEAQGPLVPLHVRYVITLDADTRLPRETVRRLIGKLGHPLNHPRFDAAKRRVVEGYAVLQPRVTPSLPIGVEGSAFQRVFSSMPGIDPYDAVVSDVYQDLFGEGSYAGKGIYDVDAFEAALADRVPDGTLLSHDLFEGTFARAGLASDVEVVEEYPARYLVATARNHRWARGDWQLLPWILGFRDSLPLLGRWKMLDNLRRTLAAPAAVLALIAGWTLSSGDAALWTLFVFATIALPPLFPVLAAIEPRRPGINERSHLRALGREFSMALAQIFLLTTLLAHQAWSMIDAIGRTLFRLIVSRRHLLEWVTAAEAQRIPRYDLIGAYRRLIASVAVASAASIVVVASGAGAWPIALPFVILWGIAPAIARRVSASPLVAGRVSASFKDSLALRLVARRTWRYFETFVTAENHMLPPDNFQEDPEPVVAHRTSPTNVGLYLLSVVSARDFGWIGTVEAVERLEATLATLHGLERLHGHFFNWYDTRDLRPLTPQYVSSVDSGNLAAHLIAVGNACREWSGMPLADEDSNVTFLAGVEDAVQLTRAAIRRLPDDRRAQVTTSHQVDAALNAMVSALRESATPTTDVLAHAAILVDEAHALAAERGDEWHDDLVFWAAATRHSIESWRRDIAETNDERRALDQRLGEIEKAARAMALAMEFDFLLDPDRKLLSIGYNASDATLDPSCYDLLASEARLASFIAIAKNDVPARHWFRLGRAVTPIEHGAALVSWSGSMFEYLMPSLVMRAPAGSLLEQTNRLIVSRQVGYGNSLNVPWGVSESAYAARDLEFTYQYSNFGVPGLGLKRGLSENLVIAPYATGLAAMVDPHAAVRNFGRLTALGARGRYGYYEALDYTRSRLPDGTRFAIVRAYMAHHQGMTIVSIDNVLFDGRMRARFHSESSVQATELLLQERTPRDVAVARPRAEEVTTAARFGSAVLPEVRRLATPHDATPQTHLLSNGRYAVMLTSAGSGYSHWRDIGITRWREDVTRDDAGSYVFLRDVQSGAVWSAGFQPSGVEPDRYDVTLTEDRAEIIRRDAFITTALHVIVSPEDDAEVRRVSITNSGDDLREIDVTSYCELALAPPAADTAHPAFSKLFVQTEFLARAGVLLATRRKRAPDEPGIWAVHHVVVEGEVRGELQYETDRAQFLGRGREVHEPIAVMDGRPLSNTTGTVLDPIFALRRRVRIQPGASVRLAFWTGVATSRETALDIFDRQNHANAFVRASTLAWTQAQVQLRHLGVSAEEASLFQRIAGHVLYADASMRPSSEAIRRGGAERALIWAHGISGDLPIVLLRIDHTDDIAVVRQLLQAHEYWRLKHLAVDVVILNERGTTYLQDLQVALDTAVRVSQSRTTIATEGGSSTIKGAIFLLRADLISAETRAVLSSVARVVFVGQRGSLEEQLERRTELPFARTPARTARPAVEMAKRREVSRGLEFFNGLGGFAAEGREYVTTLDASQSTPAPWINVIANARFGCQMAVEGGGYTWSVNSRENQLTAWSNDPVTDRAGEVLYVRDEETGDLWGPTVAPVRDNTAPYLVRHGQGYSRYEHTAHEIALDFLVYVPLADSIKIGRLKIRNLSERRRRLSVTAYVEWVLGTTRAASAPFIVTGMDSSSGAMFARNPWSTDYASRVAFADLGGRQTQWTGDRREFLGRHGRLDEPAAFATSGPLSKRTGAGFDPCCALQAPVELEPGEATEIVFFLGEAASDVEARSLIARYRSADLDQVFQAVTDYWDDALGTVEVRTPDRSMDIMLNRWLLYQTLACRILARSAFYQASGAYGFRDQLQDGMALVIAKPELTREHLLRAAGRQFPEGDVQHWWLPPGGQGVRTHISDDRIWLAYASAHYVASTGDRSILDELAPFLEGARPQPGEHDVYFTPATAERQATLFEHCALALDASLAIGNNGLPLIGTGDWNDGMNRVGAKGRGESVWLGWFLHTTLTAFAPLAMARGEFARAAHWVTHAGKLRESLEREAWDGEWYRRAFFDDGGALGSAANDECRIDAIAQSWSVISGAGDPARARRAMKALDEQLIRRDDGLALLFAPPFDRTVLEPGYVKGYPPGIRENGGQYTHAAAWSVIAFAKLGLGDKAAELFSFLNPINRSNTRTGLRRYRVEPYAVAADVYSVAPHVGRGGWTWYTGAAGWLYRAGLEAILGFQKQGDTLRIAPCIPKAWPRFDIVYRHRTARYEIAVENPNSVSSGVTAMRVDGVALPAGACQLPLLDDGVTHHVQVTLGPSIPR